MDTWQVIIAIIIAFLGYPAGLLIAKLTDEELREGKKWFKLIIVICLAAIILSIIFAQGDVLLFLICSFIFIALVALASLVKSQRKKGKR